MELILSLISFTVFAAELVSPIPRESYLRFNELGKPTTSFSALPHVLPAPAVLGHTTVPEPTSAPQTKSLNKSAYTIAFLGDSMIDTMGPGLPNLAAKLKSRYPKTTFTLLNYGNGGTNIDYGIERLTSGYTYLGQSIPALVSTNPDIVVVESFGYNPYSFDTGAIDKHWMALARIVDTIRTHLPHAKILLAATIAPNATIFGDGSVNTDAAGKHMKVTTIKKYLESTLRFAQSQKLPIADAYTPSLNPDGNGKKELIHPGDNIHYSQAGLEFFARILLEAIETHHLLEV